jgi:hypothetical protein
MNYLNAAFGAQQYGDFSSSTFSKDNEVVVVNWNSAEGRARLTRSDSKESFYQLAHTFQPQINPLYCGIATGVILLNALRLPQGIVPSQPALEVQEPEAWGGNRIRFSSYSQLTFLNEETDRVKPRSKICLENITEQNIPDATQFDPGLALDDLRRILEVYHAKVELYYAEKDMLEGIVTFRTIAESVLKSREKFVVVNFVGNTIGTPTGGHISPLGAYDTLTDSVLVMDVAGHKNPWYWVPIAHLYQAMHTKTEDGCRGWLVVSDGLSSGAQ